MEINWGLPVVLYCFFTDIGASVFFISILNKNLISKIISPCLTIIGLVLLILDLGRPMRFWRMILKTENGFFMFNYYSAISISVWILTGFLIVSILFLFSNIHQKIKNILGGIGFFLSIGVMIHTGIFLGVTSIPLWKCYILPSIFLLSAIANGIAVCTLIVKNKDFFWKINRFVLMFLFFAVILFIIIIWNKNALTIKFFLWWLGFIVFGIFIPLIFNKNIFLTTILILIGGFLVRYILIIGGQL